MTEEEVRKFEDEKLSISLNAGTIENNKFECKRQWYDLKNNESKNEFLKDLTAIINSYGAADGILVIGYEERKRQFQAAKLSDSNLTDDKYLNEIIKSKVYRSFNIQVYDHSYNGNPISIIHIPKSLHKPHVINLYEEKGQKFPNEIFVRHGSSNERATKEDLDNIYFEKPSIILEERISAIIDMSKMKIFPNREDENDDDTYVIIDPVIIFSNEGLKKLVVLDFFLEGEYTVFERNERFQFNRTRNASILVSPNDHFIFQDQLQSNNSLDFESVQHLIKQFHGYDEGKAETILVKEMKVLLPKRGYVSIDFEVVDHLYDS